MLYYVCRLVTRMYRTFISIVTFFIIHISHAVNPSDIYINITPTIEEDGYKAFKLKLIANNKWKIYGDVKISSQTEKCDIKLKKGYKSKANEYKATILVPDDIVGKIHLKAEFPACSDEQCMFVEKEFFLDVSDKLKDDDLQSYGILITLLLAMLGGLLLNCMPCVLPVLSLKLHSVMSNVINRKHMLYTWYGIIFSFSVFTAVIGSLKYFGHSVGWGMHFQNVHFLNITTLLVFLFSLCVYDRLRIVISANTAFLNGKGDFLKHVSSGVLATVLAIPCTAPFLGTATAVAIDGSMIQFVSIFMAIGFGFGLPYLLMYFFDINVKVKAGAWTLIVKHVLGLGVVLTFIWLFWLLSNHLNYYQASLLIFCYVVLFFAAGRSKLLCLVAGIAACIVPLTMQDYSANRNRSVEKLQMWESFDPIKLQEYVKSGRTVFVNITADWCMTCKYNKSILLSTEAFEKLVQKYNAVCMEGDLTHTNDSVMLFLKQHKQGGIPFNIVFGKKSPLGEKLKVIPSLSDVEEVFKKQID